MKPAYEVTALRAFGSPASMTRTFRGAPSDTKVAAYFRGKTTPFDLAVRYYPSRKGWMIIDMRHAVLVTTPTGDGPFWRGLDRHPKVYPSEEAAIMKAIHMLHPPVQLDFNL